MPVSVESSISGPFIPNGATTDFPFTFKAGSADEVAVVDQDGVAVSSALYTVTLDEDEGGTVVFAVAPTLAAYPELHIISDPDLTQEYDFSNSGPAFNPDSLTLAFDRAAVRDLYLQGQVDRAAKVPIGETMGDYPAEADRAGHYLTFDGSGEPDLGISEATMGALQSSVATNTADVDALGTRITAEEALSLRTVKAPVGETMNDLQPVASRAGKIAAWDASGQPTSTALGELPLGAAQALFADTRIVLAAYTGMVASQSAYLSEGGREGPFVWDASDLSTLVTADTAQGIYVPPASDATGASGAWVRQFDGPVDPEWWGVIEGAAAGANAAANDTAWDAMMTALAALHVNVNGAIVRHLYDIQQGLGAFEWAAPKDITDGTTYVRGRGMGVYGGTRNIFYDSTGFRVQHHNTSGASTLDGASHVQGARTPLEDMLVEGNYSGTEADFHGIHARSTTFGNRVSVRSFAGEGIRIEAVAGAGVGGDSNSFGFNYVECKHNRNGAYVEGNNANAGNFLGGIFNNNRQWGIWDSSSLGNTFTGVEIASNGVTADNDGVNIGASVVSIGGNRYFAIAGQEAGASTNAPSGTTADNTWWAYLAAGGVADGYPAWFSGILVRAGGCVYTDDTGYSLFTGGYAEFNQGKAQIAQNTLIMGGALAEWVHVSPTANRGGAAIRAGEHGRILLSPAARLSSGAVTLYLGGALGNANNTILDARHTTLAPDGYHALFRASINALLFTYNGVNTMANTAFGVSALTTTDDYGTGTAMPHAFFAPRLLLPDNGLTRNNFRRAFIDVAAPASGAHAQGEWAFHRGTGFQVGYKCTGAGTPGTWVSIYGVQSSLAGAGKAAASSATYVAPAGGATVDAEVRASLAQLAADVADLKAKLATAGIQA